MSGSEEDRQVLHVEGSDDEHAIYHLLIRHGFDDQDIPRFGENRRGKQGVLSAIPIAVRAGTGKSIGFVMDANDSLQDTWRAVAARLKEVGVQAPKEIPEGGYVGKSKPKFAIKFGEALIFVFSFLVFPS